MSLVLNALKAQVEAKAREAGAAPVGVADLEALKRQVPDLLARVSGDYSRAVVFGMRLQKAVLQGIVDQPTPLYFHNYRQLNHRLDDAALSVAHMIQEAGYLALAIPASQLVVKDPLMGHISHKLLGWAAGIGFIGRSTLLVHPEYGAHVRYVSVLTDAPLVAGHPMEGQCGVCHACVDVCPAKAIHHDGHDFDLPACSEKLREFARISFVGQQVCGICVKACAGGVR
jgi:epoxyqueuosine reductase